MKRYLILLILLVGCGAQPGKLVLESHDYPDSVDTTEYREVMFTFTLKNVGEKPCLVQNIYSPDFWKPNKPGYSGNVNVVFNETLDPQESMDFRVMGYVWDSDTIRDHMKRFAFTANIEYTDECPQAFLTHESQMWLYK